MKTVLVGMDVVNEDQNESLMDHRDSRMSVKLTSQDGI